MRALAPPAYRLVEFPSEGAILRGRFYVHAGQPRPAVVMTHGFSATISGMVADLYAERIHAAGVQVLLFDHRGFGLSGGSNRQEINRWVQARGYRDAITFLTGQPCVDPERIAIWGDSLSGAVAIGVAAFDPRVRALMVQVPACGSRRAMADSSGEGFEALRLVFQTTDLGSLPASTNGPAPVVSPDQFHTPSLLTPFTAFLWFRHFGSVPGTLWVNRASIVDIDTTPAFHAGLCSPHLTCPSLWVIADDEMPGAVPAVALAAYGAAPQPKELLKIGGGHFGLLYPGTATFDRVVSAQCRFIVRHLVSPPRTEVAGSRRELLHERVTSGLPEPSSWAGRMLTVATLDIAEQRDDVVGVARHRGRVVGLDQFVENFGSQVTTLYVWIKKKANLADGAPARRDWRRRPDRNRRDPRHGPRTGVLGAHPRRQARPPSTRTQGGNRP